MSGNRRSKEGSTYPGSGVALPRGKLLSSSGHEIEAPPPAVLLRCKASRVGIRGSLLIDRASRV